MRGLNYIHFAFHIEILYLCRADLIFARFTNLVIGRNKPMSPQTETKAGVGFKAGVKDYRLTYYTPEYKTKDTDILAAFRMTQMEISYIERSLAIAFVPWLSEEGWPSGLKCSTGNAM